MENILIRRFEECDAEVVSKIICRNLLEVNIRDYKLEAMQYLCTFNSPEELIIKAKERHSYVAIMDGVIVGTGSIGMEEEPFVSMIHSVFILPEIQGKGIGRCILNTIEQDVLFMTSKLIKVYASITALDFYLKMGYLHEYGQAKLMEHDNYHLLKTRELGE